MMMALSMVKPGMPSQGFGSDNKFPRNRSVPPMFSCSYDASRSSGTAVFSEALKLVEQFDPDIPIERAVTPPSSWYIDPCLYSLELDRVFYRGWQAVGCSHQIKHPRDFFTGRLGNVGFIICRDDNKKTQAFHNVCRHHASLLASGSGRRSCFVCPYHGWTYGLNGALLKATSLSGIQNFDTNDFGLKHLNVATWGPFVLLNFGGDISCETDADDCAVGNYWLGNASETFRGGTLDAPLDFLCRREYTIECNWKVFCDNYLDGGYHVPYAHKGLSMGLNLDSYSTTIYEKVSIQECGGGGRGTEDASSRLGSKAFYAFIYPNFMVNRYGPWMDTNLVIPLGPRKCKVIFDYFIEASFKDDKDFVEESLKESEKVQIEDIVLCENVQRGIESPAYNVGRYAPSVEKAMHHFHCLLYDSLKA